MHATFRARAAALVLSAAAVGFILDRASAASAGPELRSARTSSSTASPGPGDTSVVYGPRTFTTPTGSQTVNLERFTIALDTGAKYLLKVINGDAGGVKRATSGSIQLNGTLIVTSADLASGPQTIVRDIVPRSVDTVIATIAGSAGAHVVVSVMATARSTVTLFGPKTYVRPNGNSSSPSDNFAGVSGVSAPFTLIARNGDTTGGHRASSANVTLNGTTVIASSEIKQDVALVTKSVNVLAANIISPDFVKSSPNSQITLTVVGTDAAAPVLTITSPSPNTTTPSATITVSGTVTDRTALKLKVAGVPATVTANSYSVTVPLPNDGPNVIHVVAVDAAGNVADSTRTVIKDTRPLILTVAAPPDGFMTRFDTIVVRGSIVDANPFTVNANGVALPVDPSGGFSGPVSLTNGTNFITVTATDTAGNTSSTTRTGTRDSNAPVLTLTGPTDGTTTGQTSITVAGTVQDATAVTVTVNGSAVSVGANGGFSSSVPLVLGTNSITVRATDAAGNVTTQTLTVTRDNSVPLPPDPSTVASSVSPLVTTTFGDATAFLYSGPNPIQTGVAAGVIDRVRASVLRGRVISRQGAPIGGVGVAVLQHPEFGQTLTRADGAFDIAVNGGGSVTVGYSKSGFLPVQRQALAPRQDYAALDDVVLIPVDAASTRVDFSAAIQVARGTPQSDTLGTRRATALFAQGTHASMTLPNGTTQPLSSLTVRATEYTVGATGPAAMPAPLPPMSAYTYAAELSVDEATAAGASSVNFDKPVPVYVENFLGFPVGTPVPVASYDRATGRWVPSPDGRIIKILSTAGGVATISVSPTNAPADSAALAALGMSTAERQTLANTYAAGQTLWRASVTHFSPLDLNFPSSPPDDAQRPDARKQNDDDKKPCKKSGSVIECTTQVLGEALPVTGTPFSLIYRSNRVRGFAAAYSQRIRLTGATVPASLLRVDLIASIAGRTIRQSFSPLPNQTYVLNWDGKDSYGRAVNGAQPLRYRISYVYPTNYLVPPSYIASFGLPCSGTPGVIGAGSCLLSSNSLNGAGRESILSTDYETTLGTLDRIGERSGGWTLSEHHAYDPIGRVVYLGDGTRLGADPSLTLFAGYEDPNAPPLLFGFGEIWDLLAMPDGNLLVADGVRWQVYKVSPSGTVTAFAGTGGFGNSGDNGPATQAALVPHKLAAGPDGSVYIAVNADGGRIRRVAPNGIITTAAGNGTACTGSSCTGDGGPATLAAVNPTAVDVGTDGSIYIAENTLVRRVGPDGVIQRIAGDTLACFYSQQQRCGDGQPALQARFGSLTYLRLARDGSIYLADAGGIVWRIDVSGIVHRVAGLGGDERFNGYSGEGGPALQATPFKIMSLAPGSDGSVVFSDHFNGRLLRVGADGIISTIVGNGEPCCSASAHDGFPTQVKLAPMFLTFGPDGTLFLSEATASCCGGTGYNIHTLSSSYTGYQNQPFKIPNEDGSEVYEFDGNGRHLRTRDGLTGRTILQFGYDASGLLASITDLDGNVTRMLRDGSGQLTSIASPFGQRTNVTLDASGYLATVTNPAGETVHIQHDANGLLRSLSDPKGNGPYQFSYDSLGRLILDTDPAGGFTSLARSVSDTSVTVTTTSQMGRTTTFSIASLPTGTTRRSIVGPDGLVAITDESPNGTSVTTTPDGTVSSLTLARDPRFGLQAPIAQQFSVVLPSGLTLRGRGSRVSTSSNLQDPLSLTTQVDSLIVNGVVSRRMFDASLRTITQITGEGRQFVTLLDTLGRIVEFRAPATAPLKYSYGSRGLLTSVSQGARTLRYDYDSGGRVRSLTDAAGHSESFAYDSVGRLVKQTLPDLREILYAYDGNGNLTSLTPPGRNPHAFAYTKTDVDSSYTPPAIGPNSFATRLEFNGDHELVRVVRPDSQVSQLRRDAAGRLDTLLLPTGSIQFNYHPQTGQLASMIGASGNAAAALELTYDGRLPRAAKWSGSVSGRVATIYDSTLRTSAITVNDADTVRFAFDRDNLLTAAGLLTLTREASSGRVIATTLSSVTTSTAYDSLGSVSHIGAAHSGTTFYDAAYTRDAVGRVTQVVETVQGSTVTRTFGYDSIGRLRQVRQGGALVGDYTYDVNGNRASATTLGGSATAVVDAQDRIIAYGTNNYSYTANGELRLRVNGADTTRFTYDVLGNLLQVRLPTGVVIDYLVDALNRRIGKKVNGALVKGFLYQSEIAPIAELDANSSVVSRFVYASDENVPEYMIKSGTKYRIITDQLGSVRLVVDAATGAVAQRLDYDEFGRVISDNNPGFQPFGFAGGLYDPDTKLVRFGARDYDAETGRWTTKDPIGFAGGAANLYAYAGSDPINSVDILGLCPCTDEPDGASQAADAGASFIPFLSNFISAVTAWRGVNPITRECVGPLGRAFALIGVAIPGGKGAVTTYREAKALTRGLRGAIQAHHLKEVRHLKRMGLTAKEIANAPAVVLTRADHQAVTAALRDAMPYGKVYDSQRIWSELQRVYANFPDWLDAIRHYFP